MALGLVLAAAVVPAAGAAPPNVVFVLTDDLAWNLVQYMPHVQELQQRGMTFTRYYVTDSLCCPSRSSIFSGRFPHNTKIFTNNPPTAGSRSSTRAGRRARPSRPTCRRPATARG